MTGLHELVEEFWADLYRRDFDTALEQCDHTIELNPHFAPAYWILGVIQEQRRDFDESAAAFQRAVHLSPQTPRMHGALGRTFALSGRRNCMRLTADFARFGDRSPVSGEDPAGNPPRRCVWLPMLSAVNGRENSGSM